MLFTDGPFVTASDLNVIDGEFLQVAKAEAVVVDSSADSVLTHFTLGLGQYFISRVQNFSGYLVGIGVNSNHVAAVLNILSTAINRPRALLHQIPVTEPDPTRSAFIRWARYYCLRDFYRSVFHRRLNDRYEKKMNIFDAETKRHWETLKGSGFPVLLTPLARPAAAWEYNSGSWDQANLSAASGGTQPASQIYDVSVAYCSLPAYVSPSNQGSAESAGSTRASVTVAASRVISIDIASLNPPNGTIPTAIGTASGVWPPMPATHWNVYAGKPGGTLYLQNGSPIPIGTKTYTLLDAPLLSGFSQNAGQPAQYDFSMQDGMLWRG